MSIVEWSLPSRRDLAGIFDHIGTDDPAAAIRVVETIEARANWLGDVPLAGAQLDGSTLRSFVVRGTPYIIAYRSTRERVTIVPIFHFAQNWRSR